MYILASKRDLEGYFYDEHRGKPYLNGVEQVLWLCSNHDHAQSLLCSVKYHSSCQK